MPFVSLLYGLQDWLVDSEADGGWEGSEGEVGDDADHAELGEREEQQEQAAEQDPCLLEVAPVQQVNGCKTTKPTRSSQSQAWGGKSVWNVRCYTDVQAGN